MPDWISGHEWKLVVAGLGELAAGEGEERGEVAGVGSFEGGQVVRPGIGAGGELGTSAPRKAGPGQRQGEAVGEQAGVASVAVAPGVDRHEGVMQADADLVGRVGVIGDPGLGVIKQ